MYRFLIVEDDEEAAAELEGMVSRFAREHGLSVSVEKMATAFEFIQFREKYDLVLMDIGLPGISGMEAAELMRAHDPDTLLIFVTDLAQYAVAGYEVDALDFLVKPVTYEGLSMRLARVARILRTRPQQSICLSTRSGMRVFPASSVVFVEVRNHDVTYHLDDGSRVTVTGTLRRALGEERPPQFVTLSNCFVANADYVRLIDGAEVTMSTGEVLTMSRAKRKPALAALARYYGGCR